MRKMKASHVGLGFVLGVAVTTGFVVLSGREAPVPGSTPSGERDGVEEQDRVATLTRENARLKRENDELRERLAKASAASDKRIRALEVELEETQGRPTVVKPRGAALDKAKELYAIFRRAAAAGSKGIPALDVFKKLRDVTEDMASYFINEYGKIEKSPEKAKERSAALMLALMSGGEDSAEFLRSFLTDPTAPQADRNYALALLHLDEGLVRVGRIPVDAELFRIAMTLTQSQKSPERAAGAGLLGRRESTESRLTLQGIASNDSSSSVRAAAISALGKVGDRATLDYLKAILTGSEDGNLNRSVRNAITALEAKLEK